MNKQLDPTDTKCEVTLKSNRMLVTRSHFQAILKSNLTDISLKVEVFQDEKLIAVHHPAMCMRSKLLVCTG
jgi:hypothetical protein